MIIKIMNKNYNKRNKAKIYHLNKIKVHNKLPRMRNHQLQLQSIAHYKHLNNNFFLNNNNK